MTTKLRMPRLTFWQGILIVLMAAGLYASYLRFFHGLGAATHLSDGFPWGLWIGFDVLCGVGLAAGGFTLVAVVHIFNIERYKPILRPAILTAFLGYVLVIVALMFDLGRPYRIWHALVMWNPRSVMFEVAWCVMLYTTVLMLEFIPVVLERFHLRKALRWIRVISVPLVIAGVILSTLHQSSLGSLYLIVPQKLHPLWYSPFLPVFFFVSSLAAGIGMVVVESALSHRAFHDRLDPAASVDLDRITLSLAKGGAIILFAYFFIRLQGLVASGRFDLLATGWGAWYLFEMLGFVLLPSFVFAFAARRKSAKLARIAGVLTVLGVVLNRFNVSLIAFNWNVQDRYVPSLGEVVTSLTIVTIGVLIFRWIVNRMPVVNEHPDWRGAH